MKFTHPDTTFAKLCRYYITLYNLDSDNLPEKNLISTRNKTHNLLKLSFFSEEYFILPSPFSFDDYRYTLYPSNGWLSEDYSRILELNLKAPIDLREFRLIAANMARVILTHPSYFNKIKDYAYFDEVFEFILLEGSYELFGIDYSHLIEHCFEQKLIDTSTATAVMMARGLTMRDKLQSLSLWDRVCRQALIISISTATYFRKKLKN